MHKRLLLLLVVLACGPSTTEPTQEFDCTGVKVQEGSTGDYVRYCTNQESQ